LREAWHENAEQWIRWARSTELDHAFWRLNLPSLLELLPPPGRLTVDVGCGEGRLSRVLREHGHTVIGIESSPALAEAARKADPGFEVHVADAARMPLSDRAADLVVASMVLQSMDDPGSVIQEIARVLAPGGRLCATFVHPLNSLGDLNADASYFEVLRYEDTIEREGASMTFHDVHRPLAEYMGLFEDAELVVEAVREPVPDDDYVDAHREAARWRRRPAFLQLRALRAF
jgi:ubiquinone/menaquinone biosynthesis C-methylase UbiE